MKIIAEQKNIRMSARKVRLVTDVVKNMAPQQAVTTLDFTPKRAAKPVAKVIKQAIANATNNFKANPTQLRISEILVDEGPTFKRWRAVSRGRAHSILKRTSHVKVILEILAAKPVEKPKTVAKPVAEVTKADTTVKTPKTSKKTAASATKKTNTKTKKTTKQ